MQQGSSKWDLWRILGIGSSDIPVIMGVSPYKSRHLLYLEKTGQLPQKTEKEIKAKEFIFKKGHRIEEIARDVFQKKENVRYEPLLMQREDEPFMKASFDLANMELRKGKEVKYVSLEEFEKGECPERYFPQVQWQYLISDFIEIDVILATDYMFDGEGGKIKMPKSEAFRFKEVKVPVDHNYCYKIYNSAMMFWYWCIQGDNAPKLSELDSVPVRNKTLKIYLKKMQIIDRKIRQIDEQKKNLINSFVDHHKAAEILFTSPWMHHRSIKIRNGAVTCL